MKRKNFIVIVFISVFLGGGFFFIFQNKNKFFRKPYSEKVSINLQNNSTENPANNFSDKKSFFISGWLPYWNKNEGASSLSGNFNFFDEINPFAFEVDKNGSILDIAKINNTPWPELRKTAGEKNINIIPTVLWGDAEAMYRVFSDSNLSGKHIENIINLLDKNNFSGVDIDYEGKDVADRDNFTNFIQALHQKLNQYRKSLNCTVEARTEDSPPVGFTGTRAMSWANNFSALNNFCDTVRIMAYDQVFQIHRANIFMDRNETPSAPNASNQWAEEVMRYALRYIQPEKLTLGVPTYGWEFKLEKISGGYRYTRLKSVSFPEAVNIAKSNGITPVRENGELAFVYKNAGVDRIITFSDAESVKEKITLAKSLGLKGISLFKIDGFADPELFSILRVK